ncbi:monooxygenase [Biscogniauxia marginata]|nr:monooxygenase [Biscogniauxia marginata]
MPLKILVIGAGVCGPALALLLQRSSSPAKSHDITVVERFPTLRQSSLQIDLRDQGIPIVRKFGLLDTIKQRSVKETGFALVDSAGRYRAVLGKNESGRGPQSFSSEYEIMRGDLVDVLYSASLGEGRKQGGRGNGVRYEFGKSVSDLVQDDSGVDVTFSDGTSGRYDLVVGADGQASRTRRVLLGRDASDTSFKSLKLFIAYFTVSRAADEDSLAKWYLAAGGRVAVTRSGESARTQVYLSTLRSGPAADSILGTLRQSAERQKEAFAKVFRGAGWQVDRFVDEMMDCGDFYAQEIGQLKCETFAKGRVALLGDAGYTPSPITGIGTTLSLTGAYVLAGELARHGDDVEAALQSYQTVLRPFIIEAQKLLPGVPDILYPKTAWGVWILTIIISVVSWLGIDKWANQLMPENKGGLEIPEYPELNMES